jgi:hypothetical protein
LRYSVLEPNESGTYTKLGISIPLSVIRNGTYSYTAILGTRSGKTLDVEQGQVQLDAGSATILSLLFSTNKIAESKEDGPYIIQGLTISDSKTDEVLLYIDYLGQTNQYKYIDFLEVQSTTKQEVTSKDNNVLLIGVIGVVILFSVAFAGFMIWKKRSRV